MTDNEIVKSLESLLDRMRAYESLQASIGKGLVEDIISMYNRQKAEIGRLRSLVDTMSDYFPACINCEGKTPLGERTDKCVYLIDDTEYCAKRGIETIARIVKENRSQKAEIERLKSEIRNTDNALYALDRPLVEIKHEAYREFADKVKERKQWDVDIPDYVFVSDIDNTLDELTGGSKNG